MATALKFIVLFLIAYKVFSLLFSNNNQQKVNTKQKQQFKQTTNVSDNTDTHYEDAEFIDYEEVK